MTDAKKDTRPTGLDLLREPFPAHQISKLPKPTKRQTDEVRADFRKGIRCTICGAWHHPKVVHLDYVGHAALTDRLLDCDPTWNWEPATFAEDGMPKFDAIGGMWIKLTVCGITRLGYGHADGKKGGDAIKEVIGDALRNAAMRFGAALDLWHKGQLHGIDDGREDDDRNDAAKNPPNEPVRTRPDDGKMLVAITSAPNIDDLVDLWREINAAYKAARIDVPGALVEAKDDRKAALSKPDPQAPADDDMTPDGAPIDPNADIDDEIPH